MLGAFHFLLLASVALSLAAPSKRFLAHEVHETRDGAPIPPGWTKRSILIEKKNTFVPVRINLRQQNVDHAHDLLMEISDPDSHKYSQHLEPHEVVDLFSPHEDTINIVLDWLHEAGHAVEKHLHYIHAKGAVILKMSVEEMEELFRTEYHVYEHPESGKIHIACESYSLQAAVREHVDFILPAINFDIKTPPQTRSHTKRTNLTPFNMSKLHMDGPVSEFPSPNGDSCSISITPWCLRQLYNINYIMQEDKTSFGIVEYGSQSYWGPDLDSFATVYNPPAFGYHPTHLLADGGAVSSVFNSNLNEKGNLNLEYAIALTWPFRNIVLYQVGDPIEGGTPNQFLDTVDGSYCQDDPSVDPPYPDPHPGGYKGQLTCGWYNSAKVISTSYTYTESRLSLSYTTRQCQEYLKLGLMGVTFVYSSGDYGVAGNLGHCMNVNHQDVPAGGTVFNPTFPSGCPYILSVGATMIPSGVSVSGHEIAADFSGGGFSNHFSLPAYQANAVGNANGKNYAISLGGYYRPVSGTSASTTVFGSIIAMINDARAKNGKNPLGFVNPVFYANPGLFHDITSGSNPGCGTVGFKAVPGWDPVTGLGTPNVAALISHLS